MKKDKKRMGSTSSLRAGFTLIELLVVITIIGILIGIGLNTYSLAQKKARDTKRKSDLRSIQIALEQYASDHAGNYPSSDGSCGPSGETSMRFLQATLVPAYINLVPEDPVGGDCNAIDNSESAGTGEAYAYTYIYTGTKYLLVARMENRRDPQTCGNPPGVSTCPAGWGMSGDRLYYIIGP